MQKHELTLDEKIRQQMMTHKSKNILDETQYTIYLKSDRLMQVCFDLYDRKYNPLLHPTLLPKDKRSYVIRLYDVEEGRWWQMDQAVTPPCEVENLDYAMAAAKDMLAKYGEEIDERWL